MKVKDIFEKISFISVDIFEIVLLISVIILLFYMNLYYDNKIHIGYEPLTSFISYEEETRQMPFKSEDYLLYTDNKLRDRAFVISKIEEIKDELNSNYFPIQYKYIIEEPLASIYIYDDTEKFNKIRSEEGYRDKARGYLRLDYFKRNIRADMNYGVLTHELIHLFIWKFTRNDAFSSEGIASFFENINVENDKVIFGIHDVTSLKGAKNSPDINIEKLIRSRELDEQYYNNVSSFFFFMYDQGVLREYIRELQQLNEILPINIPYTHKNITNILETVFGKNIKAIEQSYKGWMEDIDPEEYREEYIESKEINYFVPSAWEKHNN